MRKHRRPVHEPPLRQLVVRDREMLGRWVVPDDEIALLPAMAVRELWLDQVREQAFQRRCAFVFGELVDPHCEGLVDVDRLPAGDRVRADDRVVDIRRLALLLLREVGAL